MTGRVRRWARRAVWAVVLVAVPGLLLAGGADMVEVFLAGAVLAAMYAWDRAWVLRHRLVAERNARMAAERAADVSRRAGRWMRRDRDRLLAERDHLAGEVGRLRVENAGLLRQVAGGSGRWARWLSLDADDCPDRERLGGDR